MDELVEMAPYLNKTTRIDVRMIALQYIFGLTGNYDGIKLICNCEDVLKRLIVLMTDEEAMVRKDALLSLVNVSAEEDGALALMKIESQPESAHQQIMLVKYLTEIVLDANSKDADAACMALCNLSRCELHLSHCADVMFPCLPNLMTAFTDVQYNKVGEDLNYLGPLLSNLSGNGRVRAWLCEDYCGLRPISAVASFCQYPGSIVRRGGAVGTVRNACMDVELHEALLSPQVDILSYLLYPLAGGEELSEEETNSLPTSLQFLPEDKVREPDPDIRKLLLEALNKLCTKKFAREILREKGVYYILRELHKWETDRRALLVCENVVDILIKKEDEIKCEDLSAVEVPDKLKDDFKKMDEAFINEDDKCTEKNDNSG